MAIDRRIIFSFWIALYMAFAPGSVQSQESSEVELKLGSLREKLDRARFREVVSSAKELLLQDDLSAQNRNQTLEILAIGQLALRDTASASETLRNLYSRDPGFVPHRFFCWALCAGGFCASS